jgi:hypothetical protein
MSADDQPTDRIGISNEAFMSGEQTAPQLYQVPAGFGEGAAAPALTFFEEPKFASPEYVTAQDGGGSLYADTDDANEEFC